MRAGQRKDEQRHPQQYQVCESVHSPLLLSSPLSNIDLPACPPVTACPPVCLPAGPPARLAG